MNIIEQLQKSANKLLKAEGDSIAKWQKCTHDKSGLETILAWNICEIVYKNGNEVKDVICTSNTIFIDKFAKAKENFTKPSVKKTNTSVGIYTKDPKSILTYDLIANKYRTISLKTLQGKDNPWVITHIITLSDNNIEILVKILQDLLDKARSEDNKKK